MITHLNKQAKSFCGDVIVRHQKVAGNIVDVLEAVWPELNSTVPPGNDHDHVLGVHDL